MIPPTFYPLSGSRGGRPKSAISGNVASQNREELWWLCELLRETNCRSWLEIGCREGDTFHTVANVLPKGSRMVAIDLPESRWGRQGTLHHLRGAVSHAEKVGQRPRLIIGDSRSSHVLGQVNGQMFDAILIDGDHTTEGVATDWINYSPLASKLVFFHDINGHGMMTPDGLKLAVPEFWQALINTHETREFTAPGSRMGIGAVLIEAPQSREGQ